MNSLPAFFDTRTTVTLISVGIVALWIVVCSVTHAGWKYAAILSYGMFACLLIYAVAEKDQVFQAALAFGLVAGFTELLADNWLVNKTHKLHYIKKEPILVASPMYMPFSWAVILCDFFLIGNRIYEVAGLPLAIAAMAVSGGLVIPVFEHCAKKAKFWAYTDWKHQWWFTPYFIILGEALLAAPLPLFSRYLSTPLRIAVIVCGVAEGLWIWASYIIAYKIFDKGEKNIA